MFEENNVIKVSENEKKTFSEFGENKENEETEGSENLIVNTENIDEILKRGKGILKLKKEIEVNGQKTDEIYFDFSSMSGLQYRNIIKQVERKNKVSLQGQPAGDIDVQATVFAKAADIPVAIIMSDLSMKDFALMSTVTYAFLMA